MLGLHMGGALTVFKGSGALVPQVCVCVCVDSLNVCVMCGSVAGWTRLGAVFVHRVLLICGDVERWHSLMWPAAPR